MMSSSKAWDNYKLKLALDGRWLNDKKDDNFNVNAIEKVGLFNTIETNNKDNDE